MSDIPELNGQTGSYVSVAPWPGKPGPNDFKPGNQWDGDRLEPELFLGPQQGAKTVARYREEYLMDWAKRWAWLK